MQWIDVEINAMIDVEFDAMIDVEFDAGIDPWPPFTFCCPQAIVNQDTGVSIPNLISLLPLDEVPVHVHPFAARAPCDSKGSECQCGIHRAEAASALRSRKTERAAKEKPTPISQIFFSTCCAWHPNSPPRPGEAPHPAPSARKSVIRLHRKLPSAPLRAPRRFGIRKSASNSGHSPLRGLGGGLGGGLGDASPARRGSRSRPPLRRPRPLRFERLRVPVWNPYSRGRLSPPKSEDRKGGEGKTDANLTHFF